MLDCESESCMSGSRKAGGAGFSVLEGSLDSVSTILSHSGRASRRGQDDPHGFLYTGHKSRLIQEKPSTTQVVRESQAKRRATSNYERGRNPPITDDSWESPMSSVIIRKLILSRRRVPERRHPFIVRWKSPGGTLTIPSGKSRCHLYHSKTYSRPRE